MEILIVKTPFQKKMSKEDYLASKLLALSCPNKITIYPKIHCLQDMSQNTIYSIII